MSTSEFEVGSMNFLEGGAVIPETVKPAGPENFKFEAWTFQSPLAVIRSETFTVSSACSSAWKPSHEMTSWGLMSWALPDGKAPKPGAGDCAGAGWDKTPRSANVRSVRKWPGCMGLFLQRT